MSKMIEMLADKINKQHPNVTIHPRDISYPTGYWRSSPFADVYRWEAFCEIDGARKFVGSCDTITDCLKRGKINLSEHRGSYEFHAPDRK